MKVLCTCLLVLVLASPTYAQGHPLTDDAQKVWDSGTLKFIAGWALVGGGIAMVATPGAPNSVNAIAVLSMGGGGYLVYLGSKQRKEAMGMPRPSLSFGLARRGVVGRFTW